MCNVFAFKKSISRAIATMLCGCNCVCLSLWPTVCLSVRPSASLPIVVWVGMEVWVWLSMCQHHGLSLSSSCHCWGTPLGAKENKWVTAEDCKCGGMHEALVPPRLEGLFSMHVCKRHQLTKITHIHTRTQTLPNICVHVHAQTRCNLSVLKSSFFGINCRQIKWYPFRCALKYL